MYVKNHILGTVWYVSFFRIIKRQGQLATEEWWLPEYREMIADKKQTEKLVDWLMLYNKIAISIEVVQQNVLTILQIQVMSYLTI